MDFLTKRVGSRIASVKPKIGLISGILVGITLFHYSLGFTPFSHQIYGKFYYGPVILGALWFGVRGGVLTSIFIDVLLVLHFFLDWGANIGGVWGILLDVPPLNAAGLVIGYLADAERKRRVELRKVGHLVSLGERCFHVAHEMKNIGIGIHGLASLVSRKAKLSEDVITFLRVIEKESQRIESIAKGVLCFAQNGVLNRERVDISEFLKDIVLISQEMARGKEVEFHSEIKEGLPPVWLDPDKMKEVLINITQNAVQATSPEGAVILRVSGNNGNVEIQISDTGKGISPGDIEKIFLPFFTTKTEGTGLGLAVSKRIVELHGATIEVDSQERNGTKFTINIPIGLLPQATTRIEGADKL